MGCDSEIDKGSGCPKLKSTCQFSLSSPTSRNTTNCTLTLTHSRKHPSASTRCTVGVEDAWYDRAIKFERMERTSLRFTVATLVDSTCVRPTQEIKVRAAPGSHDLNLVQHAELAALCQKLPVAPYHAAAVEVESACLSVCQPRLDFFRWTQ